MRCRGEAPQNAVAAVALTPAAFSATLRAVGDASGRSRGDGKSRWASAASAATAFCRPCRADTPPGSRPAPRRCRGTPARTPGTGGEGRGPPERACRWCRWCRCFRPIRNPSRCRAARRRAREPNPNRGKPSTPSAPSAHGPADRRLQTDARTAGGQAPARRVAPSPATQAGYSPGSGRGGAGRPPAMASRKVRKSPTRSTPSTPAGFSADARGRRRRPARPGGPRQPSSAARGSVDGVGGVDDLQTLSQTHRTPPAAARGSGVDDAAADPAGRPPPEHAVILSRGSPVLAPPGWGGAGGLSGDLPWTRARVVRSAPWSASRRDP